MNKNLKLFCTLLVCLALCFLVTTKQTTLFALETTQQVNQMQTVEKVGNSQNENTLENFRNEGFSIIESETDTGYTYEILGIPGGYPANEFADLIEMPVNDYGLTFNHWNYVNERNCFMV